MGWLGGCRSQGSMGRPMGRCQFWLCGAGGAWKGTGQGEKENPKHRVDINSNYITVTEDNSITTKKM